jgi:hypothetical protein
MPTQFDAKYMPEWEKRNPGFRALLSEIKRWALEAVEVAHGSVTFMKPRIVDSWIGPDLEYVPRIERDQEHVVEGLFLMFGEDKDHTSVNVPITHPRQTEASGNHAVESGRSVGWHINDKNYPESTLRKTSMLIFVEVSYPTCKTGTIRINLCITRVKDHKFFEMLEAYRQSLSDRKLVGSS